MNQSTDTSINIIKTPLIIYDNIMLNKKTHIDVPKKSIEQIIIYNKNINQLMSQATTNNFSIEESLKNQLKLTEPNKTETEKLL